MSCNLELGLLPSPSPPSSSFSMGSNNGENPKQEQMMTIFYNGRICVCDVTELQARSIIDLASRKAGEGTLHKSSSSGAAAAALQFQPICPKTDLSMKRSLRQFLEKRKCRIQATAPYNHL